MELYEWQRDCLEKWKKNRCRGIVNVVTGAGKTVLALEAARMLAREYPGRLRVRIVTPTLALARQWAAASRPARVGMYNGTRKDDSDCDWMIYVINSARHALARHILQDMEEGYHVFLIADECHHYASEENRKIFEFQGQQAYAEELYHCMGLSATPRYDEGGLVLEAALGREIYRYRFREAVREGTVSRFFVYQIGLSFLAEEMEEYDELSSRMGVLYHELTAQYPGLSELGGAAFFRFLKQAAKRDGEDSPAATYINLSYRRADISHMARARVGCVCELVRQLDPAARILVFCERISQAEHLSQVLRQQGIRRVGSFHSGMPRQVRERNLAAFREGEIRILIACRALDEGLDVPDAVVGIVMSGTSMTRQRIQRIGRLLRKSEDKPWACLYYLYVRESVEDAAFLTEYKGSGTVCNLSYDAIENVFMCQGYEGAAAGLLKEISDGGAGPEIRKEVRRCLLRGVLRPDWMTDAEELKQRRAAATERRERNYLLCMERLAERRGAGEGIVKEKTGSQF